MVHTTELDVTSGPANAIDRCLDGIDINNSCRQVYLRRMESIEECKRATKTADTHKKTSTIDAALMKLRIEMVDLMDQDAGLMRQMLILNEKVEELKANNISQMSKESLDSQDSLYEEEWQTNKYLIQSQDSLYHSDESLFDSKESLFEVDGNTHKHFTKSQDSLYFSDELTDESLLDSKESLYNMEKETSKLLGDSVDSLYQTDGFSSDEENIDVCDIEKSVSTTDSQPHVLSYDSLFEKLLNIDDKK